MEEHFKNQYEQDKMYDKLFFIIVGIGLLSLFAYVFMITYFTFEEKKIEKMDNVKYEPFVVCSIKDNIVECSFINDKNEVKNIK